LLAAPAAGEGGAMKIIKLEVDGFRSLKSLSWLPGDLNVVIGPNASGKSNLLRALKMVSVSAKGELGKYIQRAGGMGPIVWDGQASHIRTRVEFALDPVTDSLFKPLNMLWYEFNIVRLGVSSLHRVNDETLDGLATEEPRFHAPFRILDRHPGQAQVYSLNSHVFEAQATSVPEEETLLSAAAGPFSVNGLIDEFQRVLRAWRIYHGFQTHREAPIRAPQVTRAETQVDPDGQNLISVLHTLYTTNRDFKEEMNTAMRAAFGDDFEEIVFPPAADQRIQLRIRWRSLKREQSAADLSDGTLRFLFLLAVLANPSPPPLIAIDEPETGLHPSMMPIVAEYARDASNRSQVILTTHSPEFLDAFGEDVPTTTVVEWRNGETELRTLSGDELTYWLRQYSLGELYRSRELEAMR
jgi:predicted ATPase